MVTYPDASRLQFSFVGSNERHFASGETGAVDLIRARLLHRLCFTFIVIMLILGDVQTDVPPLARRDPPARDHAPDPGLCYSY